MNKSIVRTIISAHQANQTVAAAGVASEGFSGWTGSAAITAEVFQAYASTRKATRVKKLHHVVSGRSDPNIGVILQGEEDECLIGQLQAAGSAKGSIELAVALVVVLGREHKGGEPEVGEDEVQRRVVELVAAQDGQDEGGEPEAEDKSGLIERLELA